jgi:Leucine-rich repeat (LRR) protein
MKRIHPTIHTILVASCLSLAAGCGRSGPSSPADVRRTVDRYLDKKGVLYNSLQVRQNGLCTLDFRHMNITDLSVLNKVPLGELNIANTSISDLAPLKGNKTLTYLDVGDTQVSDLSPLSGLPLTGLIVRNTQVTDLRPISGMQLQTLDILNCKDVTDLSPLTGMPLRWLNVAKTGVTDLSIVEDMPLKFLWFSPNKVTGGLEMLRAKESFEKIGGESFHAMRPETFWDVYDEGGFKPGAL